MLKLIINTLYKYIIYLDANNMYGEGMSQKLPVDGFKWIDTSLIGKRFNKFIGLIKNYDEDSNKRYILEVDVEYPKKLHDLHSDLPFLPERMKINKCCKLVCNLYDKKLCCSRKNLKTSIKSWINI